MNLHSYSRRHMLSTMSSGIGWLAFSALAQGKGGLSSRVPHFAARAKRVIFLTMRGGPSHVDLFDHKPDFKGQITFFEMESHEALCQKLGLADVPSTAYRRNVITRGVDLNTLIGQEFEVQGVRFLGTEEAKPCYWMNQAVGPGAHEGLKGKGGLRAKILTNGSLRVTTGDQALS